MIREDFAGAGGCSQGKRLADITAPTIGVEVDPMAAATARAAGFRRIVADVRSVRSTPWGDLDGYTAGPPCQSFSAAGKGEGRRALDALTAAAEKVATGSLPEDVAPGIVDGAVLVLEPLHVILWHRPGWIVLEQVPSVLPVWERYAAILADQWGYSVATGVLNAEQYGVPQTRRRAILIARQDGEARLPTPTHSRYYPRTPEKLDPGVLPWVSMAEALGWGMSHRPSMTVTGGGSRTGGAEPFGNAARKGMLREAEAARWNGPWRSPSVSDVAALQTFPAGYPWQGTKGQQYQQVGNAVPPVLAAAVIRAATDTPEV